jgi:tripartite-type tricarboxylate transporter receptor subunit TctC
VPALNRPVRLSTVSLRQLGFALLSMCLAAAAGPTAAQAPAFPAKPIRMLLPYAAGGIGDRTARVIAQKMAENLGQQIIIDNRPGAGGVQAFAAGLQAPADGYTLVMGGNGTAISQSLFKTLPYDILKDFVQVSAMSKFSLVLLVGPVSKFRNLADLVAYAKANPGKLNLGSSSVGSTQHLAAELFKAQAGISAQVVPYKAAAELYTGLVSGDIDLAFEFLPPVLAQVRAGNVRALALAAERRNAALAEVPTTAESGLKGYEVNSWNAVSARAGTPAALVERLNKEFVAAINAPEVTQKLKDMNSEPYALSAEQTRELMVSEIARWKAVIERAGIAKN